MPIFDGSRYAGNRLALVTDPQNVTRVTIMPLSPIIWSFNYSIYVWTEGDRVDLLAFTRYQDPEKWWVIANANPEIMDWTEIPVGTIIRIPDGAS